MILLARGVVLLSVVAGCGPTVGTGGDESSSSTTASADTSTIDPTHATTGTSTSTTVTTTSVGTTVSDSSDDEADVSGSDFITAPDVPGHCGNCDVWAQDCGDGLKCSPYACLREQFWDASRCVELDPAPAQVGEPCTVQEHPLSGIDDCESGSLCWNVEAETLSGTCVSLCQGGEANPLCELETDSCVRSSDDILTLCLPECAPLEPACPADQRCVWNPRGDLDFVCMLEELVPGQSYGDDCSDNDSFGCGDGLVCQGAADVPGCEGSSCCTLLGSLDAPPACPDVAQTCLPLYADGEGPIELQQLCFCGVAA